MQNIKMFDLQKHYGKYVEVIDSKRLYKWDEKVTIFTDEKST